MQQLKMCFFAKSIFKTEGNLKVCENYSHWVFVQMHIFPYKLPIMVVSTCANS